jgi:cytochrome P450
MVKPQQTMAPIDISALPLAPRNPLPYRQQLDAVRAFHTGMEVLRDAGGPVTRVSLGPKWLVPAVVAATSPRGAHDILSRSAMIVERTPIHRELHQLAGPNLFVLTHEPWLPRKRALQPVFTKQHVREFAGHMAQAAEVSAESWLGAASVDLDAACRTLTLRALGRSVLGIDLDQHGESLAGPMRIVQHYAVGRALRPIRAPRWLPTPARRRARAAAAALHRLADEVLAACRSDPERDAPLVRALLAATDPDTGKSLSDADIRGELIDFMLAGHDTTATLLTYAFWALGRNLGLQERVRAEVAAIDERELTPADLAVLPFTAQVLHEGLRLCPPAAVTARMVTEDIDVDGYRVEAGSTVMVGIYAMHRDPELWDDPLTFDPDRFDSEHTADRDRWQYLPFGGGPRSCIGDHFAMLEATLALAVIRRIEIHSVDDDFPMATPLVTVAGAPIPALVWPVSPSRARITL